MFLSNWPITRFRVSRLLLPFLLLPILAGCFPVVDRTMKVTLSMEDNGKIYTGTGIQQTMCTSAVPWLGGMSTGGCWTKGEAVFVTVGDRGPVFMALTISYETQIHTGRFGAQKWTIPVNPERTIMPSLYYFKDVKDATTLVAVDPNNAAATMGKGVKYREITVEIIKNTKPTRGEVIKVLPMLKEYYLGSSILDFQDKPENKEILGQWQGNIDPSYFLGRGW